MPSISKQVERFAKGCIVALKARKLIVNSAFRHL